MILNVMHYRQNPLGSSLDILFSTFPDTLILCPYQCEISSFTQTSGKIIVMLFSGKRY
jgi:hypothetical protein